MMFTNIMTTGKFVWASSQGMVSDDDEVGDGIKNTTKGDGIKNTTKDDVNIEKGSGDSKEDNLPNLIDDISNMVVHVNVSNNSSNHSSSGKRKAPQHCLNKSVQNREAPK